MNRRVILLLGVLATSSVRAACLVLPAALVDRNLHRREDPAQPGIASAVVLPGAATRDNPAAPAIELRSGWVLAPGDR